MKYTYHIYESTELIVATFERSEPLPHLEVGHELLLSTDGYHEKTGRVLVVQGVRVAMTYLHGEFRRYDIHVVCQEQEPRLGI